MATNSYVTLTTTGSSPISKRFYAIMTGYMESRQKTQNIEINIGGKPLITNGGVLRTWGYSFKVSNDVGNGMSTGSYGNLADIDYMYGLNNPNGNPSDVFTLIDHYNVSHSVKFIDNLDVTVLTTVLDGDDSYFYVPVKLMEIT